MRTFAACFAVHVFLALGLSGVVAADFATGSVLARGQGVEIRQSELDDAFISFRANLAARGTKIPEGRREAVEAELLDRMVVTRLLVNRATPADRQAASTNAAKHLADLFKRAESEDDVRRQMKSLGMSLQQLTNRTLEQATSQEVIAREVKAQINISEEDLRKFYDANTTAFLNPELARATHILFASKDLKTGQPLKPEERLAKKSKAEAVLERARNGEDFSQLALTFSEDPGVKENKGEYKFARAKDDPRRAMVPEFEAAAFSMKTNQVSDLVETDFGWHIIKLHEIIPPKKTDFAEVKERIRDHLVQKALDARLPEYFAGLKKQAGVVIEDEKLAAALQRADKEKTAVSP
jgi:parvulin-like peptidyl-prolyl isomerase